MKKYLIALAVGFCVLCASNGFSQMRQIPPNPPTVFRAADCSFLTWIGALCHDTDDGKLYKWDGAALVELATASVGTVTNGKWCVGDAGGLVQCTEDAPAGAGDVTAVGDCESGGCTSFAIGGIKLGDAGPDADGELGYASNKLIIYGAAFVPATDNAYALGDSTGSQRWSDLFLGEEAVINFYGGDITLTHSSNVLTLGGGNLALGANSLTLTGSVGATGAGKATKLWAVDIESTNAPSVNGTAANATGGLITNPMTAAGDLITGGASGVATGKIAAVTAGQPLLSGGVATASAYAGYTFSGTAAQTYTFPGASATLAATAAPVFTTSIEAPFIILGSAATAADAGTIRMPNAGSILFEADVAGTDVNALSVDSSELVQIGSAGASGVVVTPATTVTGLITANGGIAVPETKLVDLSAITMSAGEDEGLALPTYADVAPATEKAYVAYDAANNALMVREAGGWVNVGASAAAPTTAHYVVTAASGNLSDESVLTEGLAIDISDAGGDGGAVTVAFDPTELTGNRTWAAGGAATIVWTWDNSGTVDPTLTFGDGLISTNSSFTIATGKNLTIGTTQLNLNDTIDASKLTIASQATGDLLTGSSGTAWERIAAGSAGKMLQMGASKPAWSSATWPTAATTGKVLYGNGTNYIESTPTLPVSSSATSGKVMKSDGTNWVASTETYAAPGTSGNILVSDATNWTSTAALGGSYTLSGANSFTGNNTFGNGDTDTLTVQSMVIGGNSREVQINAGTRTAPTYPSAAPTQDLYVKGNVETPGTVYAASFNAGTGTDGSRGITMTSNTALTPTADQLYFINDVFYFSQAGTQKTPMRLEDAQTATGKKTFQGDIAVGDASNAGSIDIYDGSSNYWILQSGALSADLTLTLPTSAGATGQYLKTTTTGNSSVLSWDTPSASADTTGGTGGVQFNAAGVLTSDAGFVFTTASDKLSLGASGGSTTGTLDLYYTGTTYAATITPNASMAADVTITLPSYTTTLLGAGANTYTGTQTLDDGVTDSPSLVFTDATDETVTFTKLDAGYLTITTVAGDGVNVLVGNLKVGNGTPGVTLDGEDAYIEGTIEVDGVARFDSGVTGALLPAVTDGGALGSGTLMWSDLYLASGGVINFNNGASTLTHSANTLTIGGSGATALALGSNNLTMTGSLAATANRVTKGWFTDIESTNVPTVGGVAMNIDIITTAPGSGVTAFLTTPSSANLATAVTGETGSGSLMFGTSPSVTTSILAVSNADIGSSSAEFGDVYLKDGAVIKGQNDQSATLTSSASTWTANNFAVTGDLVVTGRASGGAKTYSVASGVTNATQLNDVTGVSTLLAAEVNGTIINIDDSGVTRFTLPTPASGYNVIFPIGISGVTVQVESGTTMYVNGTATATGGVGAQIVSVTVGEAITCYTANIPGAGEIEWMCRKTED